MSIQNVLTTSRKPYYKESNGDVKFNLGAKVMDVKLNMVSLK